MYWARWQGGNGAVIYWHGLLLCKHFLSLSEGSLGVNSRDNKNVTLAVEQIYKNTSTHIVDAVDTEIRTEVSVQALGGKSTITLK